jgi:sugar lactone lactonase YvrE
MKRSIGVVILIILVILVILFFWVRSVNKPAENITYSVSEAWSTERVLEVPESVCWDADRNRAYVANIQGKPDEKDGEGFISLLSPEGKILDITWITQLNAPKGMAVQGNRLYVSDIDHLVEIHIDAGEILERYPAENAGFLNDVAIDTAGRVYVSDSSPNNTIYRLEDGKLEPWMSGGQLERPNGLLMVDNKLYVGVSSDPNLIRIDPETREIEPVVSAGFGIDGIATDGQGSFFISDWKGRVQQVTPARTLVPLSDTREQDIQAADIGFIPEANLILVPTFFDNRIVAYKVSPNEVTE